MPANASLVTLDQAKDWSKRLLKAAPALGSLSQAQQAVAAMLGHASWHALDRFYAAPAWPSPAPVTPAAAERSDPLARTVALLNARHPHLQATDVEVVAHAVVELNANVDELARRADELVYEGCDTQDAWCQAVEEHSRELQAPPDHLLVQTSDEHGQRRLLTVDLASYRATSPPVPSRKPRP